MKKLIIASVLSAALVPTAAFAQANNFDGFGLQLSTGYQSNKLKFDDLSGDGTPLSQLGFSLPTISSGGMPLNLGASYTAALSDRFTLGALVEYNPLSMKIGSSNSVVPATSTAFSYTGKLENQVSISLVPGYSFNDTTMGYARVGWINATAKATLSDGGSFSSNVNGLILGLGAKHLFTKNIYGFAEATYATYGSADATANTQATALKVDMTPTSYSFLVGIGYKF